MKIKQGKYNAGGLRLIVTGVLCCSVALLTSKARGAEAATVFASGLENPSKIILLQPGALLVAEAGTKDPNSGRISIVGSDASRRSLLDGLPSGLSAPSFDPDGPNGLAVVGRTLYIANGEGDTHINGPKVGSILPNPKGPSSPLFCTILRVTFSEELENLTAGFSLSLPDQFTLADGKPVTLDNGIGQTATVELFTAFRPNRPDPVTIYRNTHLYGLAMPATNPKALYVADAANNAIWKVTKENQTPRLVVRFPNTPDSLAPAGPPTSEAVPTSVREAGGGYLLVSLLSGAPFVPGASRVMLVDPKTGDYRQLIGSLSSTIDVLPQGRLASNIFVLEYSANLNAGAPGRLSLFGSNGQQVLADSLTTPSSMVIDESRGSIFVSDLTDGTILQLALP